MQSYNHKKIEMKWQKVWEKKKANVAKNDSAKPKFYPLIEFPFLSGEGLHVGHIRSYTALDVVARKRRAESFNVLYPIGYDAFGLPIENFAIKTGKSPELIVKNTADTFRRQLKALGFSFDWTREINTSDPSYYKWTQWIFLKFLEKGLAYKKKMAINWCPKDKIGLANEEVIEGKCERCGTAVEKREKEQWMLAITKYADRLDRDLDPKRILIGTRNPAKVKMIKTCLAGVAGIELVSLDDLPAIDDIGLVEGNDFLENAKKKSEFYYQKTGIPTIATDHILWIEKWPENKGFMVHMRKHANPNSPRATDDEVIVFLRKFLQSVGGESKANFHYAIAFTDETGTIVADEVPANYIMQDHEQDKNYSPGYPTERFLKDAKTGMFKSEQSDDVRYGKIITFLKKKFVPRMLRGKTPVDYLEKIKVQQKNWIGRSEGAEIKFKVESEKLKVGEIEVFTTRPDTLFGVTYLVLAPEHPTIEKIKNKIKNKDEMLRYIVTSKKKSEIERTMAGREKTGVKLEEIAAINPANKERIPIFVADYVLADYGTGAIMGVPAHDERDLEFATKYKLPIRQVVASIFNGIREDDRPKTNMPFVERFAICAVIKHWQEDKILMLDWKKVAWHTLITGGIEEGQAAEEAARREIFEETGYKNLRLIKKLMPYHSRFYHTPKGRNTFAHFETFYFELIDGEQVQIVKDEKEKHELRWVPREEVLGQLTAIGQQKVFQYLLKPYATTEFGLLTNSGKFDGMDSEEAKKKVTEFVGGRTVVIYKLRDWVFSRQRYWGEPIPVVFCEACKKRQENHESGIMNQESVGWIPVPEKDLPVKLPKVKNYKPTDTGESPLAAIEKWVNVKCPKCGGPAKREMDTMPNWAGSSWYYIAYCISENLKSQAPISKQFPNPKIQNKIKHWIPVDWYNGGMEHTTLHLLYSRFWHKFLYDLGLVPTNEPYLKRTSHGLILGEGGVKMSKSVGNVVNPDALIESFGADTLRLYEMFMGPFDQHIAWSTESMVGPRRFLEKVWKLADKITNQESRIKNKTERISDAEKSNVKCQRSIVPLLHKTIKKVSDDIEAMRFNTAVSAMMMLANEFDKSETIERKSYEILLRLIAPFAPHITEELWSILGHRKSVHAEPWPVYNTELATTTSGTIVVQVNGKVRANMECELNIPETEVRQRVLVLPELKKWIDGKKIVKMIYVRGRLINVVAEG